MDQRIDAIFENGVFKPLGEVSLPDHLLVVLRIENGGVQAADLDVDAVARQKQAMTTLDTELAQVPDNSPDDEISSNSHEKILYGGQR
jgi:predicted DNA-binding antitoxin AbrB/MazE fold protein